MGHSVHWTTHIVGLAEKVASIRQSHSCGAWIARERPNGKSEGNTVGRLRERLLPIFRDDVEGRQSYDPRPSLPSIRGMLDQQPANNSEPLPLTPSAWPRSLAAINSLAEVRRLDPI